MCGARGGDGRGGNEDAQLQRRRGARVCGAPRSRSHKFMALSGHGGASRAPRSGLQRLRRRAGTVEGTGEIRESAGSRRRRGGFKQASAAIYEVTMQCSERQARESTRVRRPPPRRLALAVASGPGAASAALAGTPTARSGAARAPALDALTSTAAGLTARTPGRPENGRLHGSILAHSSEPRAAAAGERKRAVVRADGASKMKEWPRVMPAGVTPRAPRSLVRPPRGAQSAPPQLLMIRGARGH